MASLTSAETALDVLFITSDGRHNIDLRGFTDLSEPLPGEFVSLQLVWNGQGPTLEPYTVFTQVLDSQGQLVAQQDNWPVNGTWPTTCWRPGETIVDPYQLRLPSDLVAGDYALAVGLYGGSDGQRLRTADGQDMVVIDRFTVSP